MTETNAILLDDVLGGGETDFGESFRQTPLSSKKSSILMQLLAGGAEFASPLLKLLERNSPISPVAPLYNLRQQVTGVAPSTLADELQAWAGEQDPRGLTQNLARLTGRYGPELIPFTKGMQVGKAFMPGGVVAKAVQEGVSGVLPRLLRLGAKSAVGSAEMVGGTIASEAPRWATEDTGVGEIATELGIATALGPVFAVGGSVLKTAGVGLQKAGTKIGDITVVPKDLRSWAGGKTIRDLFVVPEDRKTMPWFVKRQISKREKAIYKGKREMRAALDKYKSYGLDPAEKESAWEVADGADLVHTMLENGYSPSKIMDISNAAKPLMDMYEKYGRGAVKENLLAPDIFEQNLRKYIPYFMKKYSPEFWSGETQAVVLGEAMTTRRYKQVKLDLNRFIKRNPHLDEDDYIKLGLIKDLEFSSIKGLSKVIEDVETAKFFNALARNPQVVRDIKGGVPQKGEWTLIAKTETSGALGGKWVQKDTADAIEGWFRTTGDVEKFVNKWFMVPWKVGKVILRPAAGIRNIMSNFILNDIGGLPVHRLDIYYRGLKELINKGKIYQELRDEGILDRTFSSSDLKPLAQAIERREQGDTMMSVGMDVLSRVGEIPFKLYRGAEQWAKTAKYIHNIEKGMPKWEAAEDAMKSTFDYGKVTPFVQHIRSTAIPFFTFQYKAVPYLVKNTIEHPLRVAKWPLFFTLLSGQAMDKFGLDTDEYQTMRKDLTDRFGKRQYLLLPWRDAKDRFQFLDLTFILPWGDIVESSMQFPLSLIQNPFVNLLADFRSNKDWGGNRIWNEWDDVSIKMFKQLRHAWKQAMPAVVPGGYDWNRMYKALTKDKEESPTVGQAVGAGLGFRTIPTTPDIASLSSLRRMKAIKEDIDRTYSRLIRDASPEEIPDLVEKKVRKIQELYDEYFD